MIPAPAAPWVRLYGSVTGFYSPIRQATEATLVIALEGADFVEVDDLPWLMSAPISLPVRRDGSLHAPYGDTVDLIAPGPGVTPSTGWAYRLTLFANGHEIASTLFVPKQGIVVSLPDLFVPQVKEAANALPAENTISWYGKLVNTVRRIDHASAQGGRPHPQQRPPQTAHTGWDSGDDPWASHGPDSTESPF